MLNPADLAMGATNFIDSANFSMSKADLENDNAITSVTLLVSFASIPKPRNVAPATSAALGNSVPVAAARDNVAFCAPIISLVVNPNFANSVCNPATSEAVNFVDAPKALAVASNCLNSAPVAPEIAFTLAIACSNFIPTEIVPLIAFCIAIKPTVATPSLAAIAPNDEPIPLADCPAFLAAISTCFNCCFVSFIPAVLSWIFRVPTSRAIFFLYHFSIQC